MRVIYRKIHHARYLYIKRNVKKVWGARYLSKNTVYKMQRLEVRGVERLIYRSLGVKGLIPISSCLVTLLKLIYVSTQFPNICVCTTFKFNNLTFQTCPSFHS